jgi:raffinose synthase
MKINVTEMIECMGEHISAQNVEDSFIQGGFLTFDRDSILDGSVSGLRISGLKRWLGLYRNNVYWVTPGFGNKESEIPKETQYLIWEREDGRYGIMLPMIEGDLRASLTGNEQGLSVVIDGALQGEEPDRACLLFVACGDNPYELTQHAVAAVRHKLGTFKLREEKASPEFVDYLGWCTWDAFYCEVDEEKVISGLESFKNGGFPLGFMILDDGMWDTKGNYLNAVGCDPDKFPNGLSGLIRTAKENFDIRIFGIWHCFQGYWCGIHPESELAHKYELISNKADIPWREETDVYLVHPDKASKFYDEFYEFLHGEGADMVKVDGQCSLELFTEGKAGRVSTMQSYQQAMQDAASRCFNNEVINCMSNSTDVAYHMRSTNVWRNNSDYWPNDAAMQQPHVQVNAMNAMWSSAFTIPDWDMFQTHSVGAHFHAAARAVSGGPVYVCDYPGKQNFDILHSLTISDGRVLRCDRPALPTRDRIFVDCCSDKILLKIFNYCGNTGVLGLFHCDKESDAIANTFTPGDVEDLKGERFAVYFNRTRQLQVMSKNEVGHITLAPMEYEILTFTAIDNGMACLGLVEKLNGSAGIDIAGWTADGSFRTRLKDGGQIAFYCEQEPKSAYVNGSPSNWTYDADTLLLTIAAPAGAAVEVLLEI